MQNLHLHNFQYFKATVQQLPRVHKYASPLPVLLKVCVLSIISLKTYFKSFPLIKAEGGRNYNVTEVRKILGN